MTVAPLKNSPESERLFSAYSAAFVKWQRDQSDENHTQMATARDAWRRSIVQVVG